MVVLTVYGSTHSLWWCSQFMVVLTVYGGAHSLWWCSQFMVVLSLWWYSQFMALLTVYGSTHNLWWYSQFMVVLTVYSGAHSLWWCSQFMKPTNFCCRTVNTVFCDINVLTYMRSWSLFLSVLILAYIILGLSCRKFENILKLS